VNGDGLDDLIIGAVYADANGGSNAGKSYVVFGKQDNTAINLSAISPLITKPPVPAAMADKLMASVLFWYLWLCFFMGLVYSTLHIKCTYPY
jgi:hypothetical protein